MLLANNRIEIDARSIPSDQPLLEVVMIGHAPGPTVHWQRLAQDEQLLAEIASLGFSRETSRLRTLAATMDVEAAQLYLLPIPLYSFGQFQALFPDAFDTACHYRSELGGDRAWLPLAVQDFFESSGVNGQSALKLWIIRVPEEAGVAAFLPEPGANMLEAESLGAFERALLIPQAAILALPDLERLQIPVHLPDIPRLRLVNPEPVFLPCGQEVDDGHRERRHSDEMPKLAAPLAAQALLAPIARTLARLRPDMQCLLTVALDSLPNSEGPVAAQQFLDCAARLAGIADDGQLSADAGGETAGAARHLQLIFPYLRGPDRKLSSPAGLVAGMQAKISQLHGPWRSIGERPLPGRSLPWPPVNQTTATALRHRPGVTVLLHRAGRTVVDDERLCAPCLSTLELQQLPAMRRIDEHWRSAEVMRFMGWLRRQLQALGERMIFNLDPQDPRPELALRAFFSRLYSRGALRGVNAESAFTLTKRDASAATLAFDIEIAPAYAIDRLRITFMQDRHATGEPLTIEVKHG